MTVLLPTPEGPDRTVSRDGGPASPAAPSGSVTELPVQGRKLVGAKAAYATGFRDLQALHDLPGTHLPHAWQRLEQGRNLHLADDVARLAILEDLGQRSTGVLQTVLHLGALAPCFGGLGECGCALLGGQGRQGHAGSPRGRAYVRGNVRRGRIGRASCRERV